MTMRAVLVLEDGTVFHGRTFGATGTIEGEVVFNTGMTGYQETLTDPSYRGQIVVMTYPMIGNYGVNTEDQEASTPHAHGLVVHEACRTPSNWRSQGTLADYMEAAHIVGIEGIDTRELTRRLRSQGTMRGVIAPADQPIERLVARAKAAASLSDQDLVAQVSVKEAFDFAPGDGPRVAVIDLGSKANIYRSLAQRGCGVRVFPARTAADDVLSWRPDGVLLSNGPGDPLAVPYAVETAQRLIGRVPVFGICLGHQVLALALGGTTYRLKYGHRGANHPVKDLETGRSYITSQNHGFAVSEEGLEERGLIVTHRNLNDGTVEGLRHKDLPVASIQYHPEASPGPRDSAYLFDRFVDSLRSPAGSA